MSGGIELREGGADTIDELMTSMVEAFDPAFGEAWSRAQCRGIFDLPGVRMILARSGGEAAGFALMRTIIDETELLLIAVRPGFRGQGIGRALLDAARERAKADSARVFHLEVREGNSARRLYDKAGFVQVGVRRGYYRGKDGDLFDAATLNYSLIED